MRRIVLDTNVLVSGLLTPHGNAARIVDAVLAGKFLLLYDQRILEEYREVLSRPSFKMNLLFMEEVLAAMEQGGESVPALPVPQPCSDPDDTMFLEVALGGQADALITGNKRHFPSAVSGFPILSPVEFLLEDA
jgi:putative PIN family toxin of toxin-antitoxin system